MAFNFMCSSLEDTAHHITYSNQERMVYVFAVGLILQELESGILVIHLTGSLTRTLTKDYVDRLTRGYPPLLEDPLGYSITKANDEARGGWVVALGFDSDGTEYPFLPVYLDSVCHRVKCGQGFWRSMDRVLDIVVYIWSMCFFEDAGSSKQISGAIKAIEHTKMYDIQSSVSAYFRTTRSSVPPTKSQKRKIIENFNGSPRISEDMQSAFQAEWEPFLVYALVAAVEGCKTCITYLEYEGRGLEEALGLVRMRNSTIYLRGC